MTNNFHFPSCHAIVLHAGRQVLRSIRVSTAWVAATVAIALAGSASFAMAADEQPGIVLDEVIVTAQKREERLQDVPIAISVVDSALLASTNSRNLTELQGAVPSVFFAGNSGGGRTYIT